MITIKRTEKIIKVKSPYSPELPKKARQISGVWDPGFRLWLFPIEAEPQVRRLYVSLYGEWDDLPEDTVNLICECNEYAEEDKGPLTLGGRIIASAYGRDSGAKTEQGVIVISGGFGSAGSMKHWVTYTNSVKFKLIKVPRIKANELIKDPEWCDSIKIEKENTNENTEKVRKHEKIKDVLTMGRYYLGNGYDPAGWWHQTPAGEDIGGANVISVPVKYVSTTLDSDKYDAVFVDSEVYAVNKDGTESIKLNLDRNTHQNILYKAFIKEI